MASVGDIVVKLEANAASFNKAMSDASKKTEQLSKSLGGMGKAMTAGLTLPIGIAAAALGGMVISTMKAADKILLLSQRSGLSTKGIQELTFAGNLAGVSIDTMATASAMLTRNLVDAANGVGEAKDTVASLGLELRNTGGEIKSQEELFNLTLEALSGMSNETEQAAAAMELFGRGGKEMLPLLKTFPGGFKEVREEAKKLGLVMSDKTVRALDLLDDALSTRLPGAFRGATNAIVENFLPAIENQFIPFIEDDVIPAIHKMAGVVIKVFNWFNKFSTPVKIAAVALAGLAAAAGPVLIAIAALMPVFATLSTVIFPAIIAKLGVMATLIGGITLPIWLVIGAVAAMGVAWAYFSKDIIDFFGKAIDWAADKLNWVIDKINIWNKMMADFTGEPVKQLERFATGAEGPGERFKKTMNSMDDSIRTTLSGISLMADTGMPKLGKAIDTAAGKVGKIGKPLEEIKLPPLKLELMDEDELQASMDAKIKKIGDSMQFIEKRKPYFIPPEYLPELSLIESAWVGIGHTIGNVLQKTNLSFSGLKDSIGAVVSAVSGFVKELLKIAAKKALLGILNSLTGGTSGAATGILGGARRFLGFAKGGIINEPTAMIGLRSGARGFMGEAGPEAIVPLPFAGGGRGGRDLSMVVNIYGSVGIDDIGEQLVNQLRTRGI